MCFEAKGVAFVNTLREEKACPIQTSKMGGAKERVAKDRPERLGRVSGT